MSFFPRTVSEKDTIHEKQELLLISSQTALQKAAGWSLRIWSTKTANKLRPSWKQIAFLEWDWVSWSLYTVSHPWWTLLLTSLLQMQQILTWIKKIRDITRHQQVSWMKSRIVSFLTHMWMSDLKITRNISWRYGDPWRLHVKSIWRKWDFWPP